MTDISYHFGQLQGKEVLDTKSYDLPPRFAGYKQPERGNGKAEPSDNSAGIPSHESQLEEDVEWGKARVNGVEIGWNLSEQYVARS